MMEVYSVNSDARVSQAMALLHLLMLIYHVFGLRARVE